ncbi:acetyltransferase [Vibrio vulnificus]|uniref:acetyltransferase n=1 Tax=Vibrio vulnificus TaxID=672 RepID=UPI0013020EA5|nr:acetyltransferase [Vibrio vulnificus]EIU7613855.1 acetyltransferase [Vibrio vulnificus]EIU7863013.1 acetyltransferase [Vibrio vulnificus]MCU8205248.1 acetyltransferase [Vibrio vulnificus]MCU8261734.1 acetyltransferase [Vibrio vulnificus]MCU8348078.1 acetyltransferase [Vibrio vulnificus]
MEKVVIFGIGQIAEIAHFYLTTDSDCEVVAFTVDKEFKDCDEFHGLPVVDFESISKKYPPSEFKLFVPISYTGLNKVRANKYKEGKDKGYSFITYISSKARYYGTPVGENCFIFEDNVIQPFTEIGDNCILWSGNHIGHHTKIGNHCFIASHVVISGSVTVGDYSFIGVNATIRDNITIGNANIIGASTTILQSTEDKSVYASKSTEKYKRSSDKIRKI